MKWYQTKWFQINSTIGLILLWLLTLAWYGNSSVNKNKEEMVLAKHFDEELGTTTTRFFTKDELLDEFQKNINAYRRLNEELKSELGVCKTSKRF